MEVESTSEWERAKAKLNEQMERKVFRNYRLTACCSSLILFLF